MALVADIPGAVERGLKFRQAEQLRPIQQQTDQLGLGLQQQKLTTGGLQQQAVQQQIDIRSDEQKNKDFVLSALRIKSLPDDQKLQALINQEKDIIEKGGDPVDTRAGIQAAQEGRFDELNQGLDNILQSGVQQGIIKAAEGAEAEKAFTLSEGQTRFGPGGKVIAQVAPRAQRQTEAEKEVKPIPLELLVGLDDEIASKGAAAFQAAGGGSDGLKAFQKIVDAGTEQQKRLASPAILKSSFPRASKAETVQLQAAMDSAKTTESGLKAATKVRSEQRRTKKAQAFQTRAVELLDNILASGQGILGGDLGDVLGSIEGAIDVRFFSDDEAEIIADIEEATNILTADNMDLMTGVLSESDIKILKSLSGGALNRKRTKERFVKDVTTIRDKLASQKVVTVDEQQAERDKTSELPEGTIIRNPTTGERMQVTNGQLVGIE